MFVIFYIPYCIFICTHDVGTVDTFKRSTHMSLMATNFAGRWCFTHNFKFYTCLQLKTRLFTDVLFVDVQFVPLIWFNLTWCSSNSLNSYIKSVNTVLFNPQNYFQKASSPLRGHQTRFKVHILSQPAYHCDHRRMIKALQHRDERKTSDKSQQLYHCNTYDLLV